MPTKTHKTKVEKQKRRNITRDIPFWKEVKCDICGELGAFDFTGDFICSTCLRRIFD
jgi:uncharacterized membrane protein